MKQIAWLPLWIAFALCAPALAAPQVETETLSGEYVWSNNDMKGELEAVFTPAGENRWDVAFPFTFRGKPRTYSGEAEGSLTQGTLKGRVLNESKRRTFRFAGAFEDGTFRGTHAELSDGEAYSTGTLMLER